MSIKLSDELNNLVIKKAVKTGETKSRYSLAHTKNYDTNKDLANVSL